ncbi:proteasome ATPase [Gleimia hominis]|uniref:AAA ATPase forming ring-shaped complexes n=1 Tax=Gleimia hominis TaxID=595468 RepID=A0ABU3IDL5_9ACTO|nr:proteasome ATPase [Gleimia hominis]MDT3767587.1 proteasome ATPase [Gleimia hominis]
MSAQPGSSQLHSLQDEVSSLEGKNARLAQALGHAREQLSAMRSQLEDVTKPPAQIGTFIAAVEGKREAEVSVSGRFMHLGVAPGVDLKGLACGEEVRIDEHMVVVERRGVRRTGSLASVVELQGADRVLVNVDGSSKRMLKLAGPLRHGGVKPGDSMLVDVRAGVALERIVRSDVEQLLTPEVPDVTYDDIGGLAAQIQKVRDSVELPFKHPQLYRDYGLRSPKGILLYGPPGCGKTLIAKAVARSLAMNENGAGTTYFLSVKGPELLNKFVGETERQIRSIFARARSLASADVPVVIFFDEMEALFRTRGSGISSDIETMVVPQLLAEMDGVEALDNVIIIGASNREDMIDPAVLRPGRLDIRIRIERPDRQGAREIFSKYLTEQIPIAPQTLARFGSAQRATQAMSEMVLEKIFARRPQTALFNLTLATGELQTIYADDLISGAMIAAIVERAKKFAVKATLAGQPGLTMDHLQAAFDEEMRETKDLGATTTPAQWARTTGLRGEGVVSVSAVEQSSGK